MVSPVKTMLKRKKNLLCAGFFLMNRLKSNTKDLRKPTVNSIPHKYFAPYELSEDRFHFPVFLD